MIMPETNKRRSVDEIRRVYSPSRGNLAIKSEALPYTRVAEPVPAQPRRRPTLVPVAPAPHKRTLAEALKENKVLAKAAAVGIIIAVAFAFIVTLSGYNNIAAVQREINELSGRVSTLQRDVQSTSLMYDMACDTDAAHDAAAEAGMYFPVSGSTGD